MPGTAWEVRMNSKETLSYGLLHMDSLVLANQQKLTFINSMQNIANLPRVMAYRKNEERESEGNLCCQHTFIMILMMMMIISNSLFSLMVQMKKKIILKIWLKPKLSSCFSKQLSPQQMEKQFKKILFKFYVILKWLVKQF